jgi:hypothetical protein
MKLPMKLLSILAVVYFLGTPQNSTGDISGSIRDSQGVAVSNARVEIKNRETGVVWQIVTDESGRFVISVPPGIYDLTVFSPGFKEYKESNLTVSLSQSKTVEITMSVGAVSETVEVVSAGFASVELTWNAWAEPASPSPSFAPVPFLEPGGKNYSLILDLSAFAYSDGPNTYSRGVGAKVKEWLLKSKAPDTDLKLVIIPDEKYFEPLAATDRAKTMRVDLKRLRKALKEGVKAAEEPFKVLQETPEVDFSFGRVSVNLRTRSLEGEGAVAIALWADGVVPIDEVSIPLCLARDAEAAGRCDTGEALHDSLAGIDPIRAAAQQQAFAMKPDAALHFIELDSSTTVGVFRDNAWPEGKYVNWTLTRNPKEISDYLQQTLLPNFDRAANESELIPVGSELYNLLFPTPNASEARAAFAEFVRSHPDREDPANPPSIFVRVLSNKRDDPPFLVPLGLMVHDFNGRKDFLGFHFRIQTPLEIQDYLPSAKCIANWVVLAPPVNSSGVPQELTDARNHFSDWYAKWRFKEISAIPDLIEWAGEDVDETTPVSLFLLAHQDSNSLYFQDSPRLGSEGIQRHFKEPSVAIVNGCATGAPGTSAIVQKLNSRSVSTIIATAAKVDPNLAGDFFSVLADYLTSNPAGKEYPLGIAHFLTLKKLRRTAPDGIQPPYGAKALAYELLGNSSVRVCAPPPKSRR